jgi:hypothetical protein
VILTGSMAHQCPVVVGTSILNNNDCYFDIVPRTQIPYAAVVHLYFIAIKLILESKISANRFLVCDPDYPLLSGSHGANQEKYLKREVDRAIAPPRSASFPQPRSPVASMITFPPAEKVDPPFSLADVWASLALLIGSRLIRHGRSLSQ